MATTGGSAKKVGLFANPREDWLALHTEEIIDPGRAIIDAHHHLWERGDRRYLLNDLSADIASGHNVVATVYVECHSMYRASGPEAFRPVGEVEFANGVAAMSATGAYGPAALCAGIVGHVNLLLADSARPVLEAKSPRATAASAASAMCRLGMPTKKSLEFSPRAEAACSSIRIFARASRASRRSGSPSTRACSSRRSTN